MKLKRMNEDLIRDNNIDRKVNKEAQAVVPPDYKQAVEDHEEVKKNLEKDFKEQDKEMKDFIKKNHDRKVKLDESLFDEYDEDEEEDFEEEEFEDEDSEDEVDDEVDFIEAKKDVFYKKRREPLADIIQMDLTTGEPLYKLNDKGNYTVKKDPYALNLDVYQVGVNSDEKGDFIKAYVPDEETAIKVERIGEYYDRETKRGQNSGIRGNDIWVKIYLKDEDWEGHYVDTRVKVRGQK